MRAKRWIILKMEQKGTDIAKRPGGYLKGDVDEHGCLSPGVNLAHQEIKISL